MFFETGDIAWYKTGVYSASRVKIIRSYGHGACLSYIVEFLDTSPEQPSSREGIAVSGRSLVPLTEEQKQLQKICEQFSKQLVR